MPLILLMYNHCLQPVCYSHDGNIIRYRQHERVATVMCASRAVAIRDSTEHPALVLRLFALTPLAILHQFLICAISFSI
jgi:hypothetical protein